MNLAAGALLLSLVLAGAALLCCAEAADFQMVQVQRKVPISHSERPASKKADTKLNRQVNRAARSSDAARMDPVVVPPTEEKKDRSLENPVESPVLSVQFKGVRG
ncbi:MAG: hypothetical protein PHQ60_14925 [Sideroxydans sp.]|nr:hypothetical protein [Sideroxydans sp.]